MFPVLRYDNLVPLRYDAFIPLRHDATVPFRLGAQSNRLCRSNSPVDIWLGTLDIGRDGWVGKSML